MGVGDGAGRRRLSARFIEILALKARRRAGPSGACPRAFLGLPRWFSEVFRGEGRNRETQADHFHRPENAAKSKGYEIIPRMFHA